METKQYRYDAFISYRHEPLASAVATKLQRLLEGYAAPWGTVCAHTRRIQRVFVDTSEMPNIPDLTAGIEEALAESRYLIVLCSESLLSSKWCRQEVVRFKELHQGSAAHIIPVLISGDTETAEGEASRVFFPEMLTTRRVRKDEAGNEAFVEEPIKPLYTDVRGATQRQTLQRLTREKLRIAAPLLGCGYDDLYRRHRKRAIRRTAVAAVLAVTVAAGVGTALLRVDADRRDTSALLRYRLASEAAQAENPGLAMRQLVDSLRERPRDAAPQAMSLSLLMQQAAWPVRLARQAGTIAGNVLLLPNAARAGAPAGARFYDDSVDPAAIAAYDAASGTLLVMTEDGYAVVDGAGETVQAFPAAAYGLYTGAREAAGCFVFQLPQGFGESRHTVYLPAKELLITLPLEDEPTDDPYNAFGQGGAMVHGYADGTGLVAVYSHKLAFFQLEGDAYVETGTMTSDALFERLPGQQDLGLHLEQVVVDPKGLMLAVTNSRQVTLVGLVKRSIVMQINQTEHYVSGIAFSREEVVPLRVAITYGMQHTMNLERGGGFEVWSIPNKERIYSSEGVHDQAVAAAYFSEDSDFLLTTDFTGQSVLWQMEGQSVRAALSPVVADGLVRDAMPDGGGLFSMASEDGVVTAYGALMPRKNQVIDLQDARLPVLAIAPQETELLLLTRAELLRVDAENGAILSRENRTAGAYADFLRGHAAEVQGAVGQLYREQGIDRVPAWMEAALQERLGTDLEEAGAPGIQLGSPVVGTVASADGRRLYAAGSQRPFVACYDVDEAGQTLALREMIPFPMGSSPASVFLLADGRRLAVGMTGGEVRLYEAERLASSEEVLVPPVLGEIKRMAMDAAGRFVAATVQPDATTGETLLVWHAGSQTLLYAQAFPDDALGAVAFAGDDLYYGRGSALYRLMLETAAPGTQRLDFFDELSSYALDNQGVMRQTAPPALEAIAVPEDAWSRQYTLVTRLEGVSAP